MKSWLRAKISSLTKEDMAVIVFGATFMIGIWYAIPMVNTITDVWAYGGGVLRSMEAHRILPGAGNAAYGTITFFQNYFAMAIALSFGLLFNGFDLEALKALLILNPSYTLIPSRMVSALTAMVLVTAVYRFLKEYVISSWWRFALLVLVFGNVLATILIRSGKMWILSTTLAIISFIYLYRSLTKEQASGIPGRASLVSVVTAFLAAANFPFAVVFLINIPIIFLYFPKTAASFKRQLAIVSIGLLTFLCVAALNFHNTFNLIAAFIAPFIPWLAVDMVAVEHSRTVVEAFLVNVRHTIEAFPLLLVALLIVVLRSTRSPIRYKMLLCLSVTYGLVYIVMASVLFRTDHGLALNVRHIFPLAFFLMFAIISFREPARRVSIAFISIGLIIYGYTLILLSVPTTYNQVSDFLVSEYGDKNMRIDEDIFELTLPMSKYSYELFKDELCDSTCTYRRKLSEDIDFLPVVVTRYADEDRLASVGPADLVVVEDNVTGCSPVARFGNDIPDTSVFDIDINTGRMLMLSFYKLERLGKNIYVYDTAVCESLR